MVLLLLWVLSLLPLAVQARVDDPVIIESEVLVTAALPPGPSQDVLLLQATSWVNGTYYYVLTLTNISPWPLDYMHLLDRYFPDDPLQEEQITAWPVGRVESGQSATLAIFSPDGPLENACHQLEMHWSDGWSAILMDCSIPPATTLWEIPLNEAMAVYPQQPPLTMAEPVGPSKMGIHVTRNSSPYIMEFVEAAQPAVVVAVGDLGWLADVKTVSPGTLTLGRLPESNQSMTGDPQEAARAFVNAHAGIYLANPGVDYWLGWNEPGIAQSWQMAWYAAFEAERTVAMAELGLQVAIGNFSTGTPEAERFLGFLPALQAAKEYGGILALHEYSAPSMRDGVGAGIPGMEAQDGGGALTLRYRYWYDHYLQANDLVLPLVITEAGIDGGVLRSQGLNLGGWRDFVSADKLPEEMMPQTLTDYVEQLSWYDDELRRDPYVLGFAIFNVGDMRGQWASFDVTDELHYLTEMAAPKQ
jgi:hypothetical protein